MTTTATSATISWKAGNPVVSIPDHPYGKPVVIKALLADGDGNTKTKKNKGKGYLSAGLSLAPHKSAGIGNLCTDASEACVEACLDGTGLGAVFPMINAYRQAKSVLYYQEREWFMNQLVADLERWQRKADRADMLLCVRLNMFSDVCWESHGIIDRFPRVQFYDYTKHLNRSDNHNPSRIAPNYWVTYSRSETNSNGCLNLLARRANVAIVFHNPGAYAGNRAGKQVLPKTWNGYKVIDGDETDLRFLDPRGRKYGRVIGLKLKAANNANRQLAIDSGFSVEYRP